MEEECIIMRTYLSFLCAEEYCSCSNEDVKNGAKIWSEIIDAVYKPYDND